MPEVVLPALLRDIWEGVRSRPGRFGLSLFAMTIGMAVLTTLIALLAGLESRSEALTTQLGTNVIAVLPSEGAAGNSLSAHHTDLLRANYPDALVSGMRQSLARVSGHADSLRVFAVEEAFFTIREWPLLAGRFFDAQDLKFRHRYAVVTNALLQKRGWKIGSTIALRDTPFHIVGVVGANDSALNTQYGDERLTTGELAIFVPLSVNSDWENAATYSAALDAIYLRPNNTLTATEVLPGLQSLLAQPDLRLHGLSWVIPASLIKKVRQMQGTVGLSVGTIAILCLVLGGTTLTSLLVANVRERIAEIGLRRAMGATEFDIAALFMAEGCFATVSAALIGTLLVHAVIAQQLQLLSRLPLEWGMHTLLLPLFFSFLLGALFSLWPALAAARISPADALRND